MRISPRIFAIRLIHVLTWEESDKSGVMGELWRIVRHSGAESFWVSAEPASASKTILAALARGKEH